MKRVDFLAWRPIGNATSRCRGADYARAFAARGWRLRFLPPAPDALFRRANRARGPERVVLKLLFHGLALVTRLLQVLQARQADAVVVQRELFAFGPPFLERLLARLNPRLIYDFDDAVDLPPPHLRRAAFALHDWRKPERIARLAAALVPATPLLAERVSPEHARVRVIPTPVDTRRLYPDSVPPEERPAAPSMRTHAPRRTALVWIGTGGNLAYLCDIAPILGEVQRQTACDIVVVSEWDFRVEGMHVENVGWTLENERDILARCDIGLMPLPDNAYTRGKAGYKLLLYWAMGLPVVASPVGWNRELVQDGVNGFLCAEPEAWGRRLRQLLGDAGLRARLGTAGRERVEREYSVEALAPRWIDLLEELCRGR